MLARREGETLAQLLTRLDLAIGVKRSLKTSSSTRSNTLLRN